MNIISSLISHLSRRNEMKPDHSSLQFKQRFTLIELLVDDTCFTWDTTKK